MGNQNVVSLKQQLINYSALFKQLFFDYYSHQKKLFWMIQLLMIISTASGLFWMLSLILGISHYQNPSNIEGLKGVLFSWVFQLPIWQWLLLASSAGVISAWTLYLSIQVGVKSVLAYQKELAKRCLTIVNDEKYQNWIHVFEQTPRLALLRLLRQGIQLSGLVARRMSRAFVWLVTFLIAFILLVILDAKLLSLLLPFSLLYIISLYFINRFAARTSTLSADLLPVVSKKFSQLVNNVLNKSVRVASDDFNRQFDESMFMQQAHLKYQRRLAEIHVNWLNTLFLVFGVAVIIIYIVYVQSAKHIDWQHLLFFLIALKYAANALQQISATTVAFSRFMPEIQLVYRLLNVSDNHECANKMSVPDNSIIFIPSSQLDDFEFQQLRHYFEFTPQTQFITISDLRNRGIKKYFEQISNNKKHNVVIDNNINRLKKMILTHENSIRNSIGQVIVFSNLPEKIQQLSIDEFLQYQPLNNQSDFELDSFE